MLHFVQADGKSEPHPLSALLQDAVTATKTKTKHQTRPGNLPNTLLLRPHLPPNRINDVKGTGREKKRADGGVQRGSLLPPIENSVTKGRATRELEEPKAGLAAPLMQRKFTQLPALGEQRSLKKSAAFSPGGFERLRRERVAAVAGVAAALCPEGTKQEKAPTPRAKQVLLNLQPYKVSREQCMKAFQMNQLRKWSQDESLGEQGEHPLRRQWGHLPVHRIPPLPASSPWQCYQLGVGSWSCPSPR
ncbi:hypothetical protein EK904_000941 [Melospiza melodia maxima]|nr:hypothetical protein EK904_000941 [Melospiza melodia maxima]